MDYSKEIWSVTSYIERRIKSPISYQDLVLATGFSYRHLRDIFKRMTGISLSRYINSRKAANAAFMLVHTEKSATDIAFELAFESYDTFTRVFKRELGKTPSEFRKEGRTVGKRLLGIGMYAPFVFPAKDPALLPEWMEEEIMSEMVKTSDSCILYGVEKVHYGFNGWQCSPFPMCLKVVLNYLGQEVEYPYLMAASGLAFRLRWNQEEWDPGNVGIQTLYEDPNEGYRRAFEAVGRKYIILERQGDSPAEKEVFKTLICRHLDQGHPLISIGIVGPPEAGLITGYRDGGETLLGWSLFQENLEFAGEVTFDDCGYYVTNNWWEQITAVIAVGEAAGSCTPVKEILENGLRLLTREEIPAYYGQKRYYGGLAAYRAWADAVADDRNFTDGIVMPILLERLICQGDAEVMVSEGRYCAAGFLKWRGADTNQSAELYQKAAGCLEEACGCMNEMIKLRNGYEQSEETLKKFTDSKLRGEIAGLIRKAAKCEDRAVRLLEKIKIYGF